MPPTSANSPALPHPAGKRVLYLDPFSGIAGDMLVGALLDLGLDLAKLHHELAKLNLGGYHLSSKRVMRGALSAIKFDVRIDGVLQTNFDADPLAPDHTPDHEHGHAHGHDHDHDHGHAHSGTAAAIHLTFAQIKTLILESTLAPRVKERGIAVFFRLAQAEGRMHNMPPETVTFHEVGALDSIIDIVGACIGLELLGIDELWSGPVALGAGYVKCDHGLLPVPAPATLDMAQNMPLRASPVQKELTTPTGAAILAALCSRFGPFSGMTLAATGYGAGSRDGQAVPNVLRASIASAPQQDDAGRDTILELQANIDDASGEVLGHLLETLLDNGALDVFHTPIQMKKSRPATLLTVLLEPALLDKITSILFRESTTFGVRYQEKSRLKLARRMLDVETPFGAVKVKVGAWHGRDVSLHPEYEDCRLRAKEHGVELRTVQEAARSACARQLAGERR
jgi:uncharacterized protein (TIGR00299 family) protein